MSYWNLLGIEATDDLATIKRAYARLLKQTRPDDDAEAYQRLREAYDWAQGYARWRQQHPEDFEDEAEEDEDNAGALDDVDGEAESTVAPPFEPLKPFVDPAAVLMPLGAVAVSGAEAGMPRDFTIVASEDAPERIPRWWSPTYETAFEDALLDVGPFDTEIAGGADAEQIIDCLDAWREAGDDDTGVHAATLTRLFDTLPFAEQDTANAWSAGFVLEHAQLPAELIVALAEHFAWGQDFQLEPLIGEARALTLYERVDAARKDTGKIARGRQHLLQANYRNVLHTARLHDAGRWISFWVRVVLNPLALAMDLRSTEVQGLLRHEHIAWDGMKRRIDIALITMVGGLLLGLGLLQGSESLLSSARNPVPIPVTVVGFSLLLLALCEHWPAPALNRMEAAFATGRFGRWLARAREGKALYWSVVGWMAVLEIGVFFAAATLVQTELVTQQTKVGLAVASAVLAALPLLAIWPYRAPWENLMLPIIAALVVLFAQAFDGPFPWAMAIPAAVAWVAAANTMAIRHPELSSALYLAPFSVLRPRNAWGWIAFVVFIKGVAVFYAALFVLTAPLNLFSHARLFGWLRALLVLVISAALFAVGWLPHVWWAAVIWLQGVLFVFSRISRLADKCLDSKWLAA